MAVNAVNNFPMKTLPAKTISENIWRFKQGRTMQQIISAGIFAFSSGVRREKGDGPDWFRGVGSHQSVTELSP
jgi:hypothetical protein